mgnify:CR=1 FL=1
MIRRSSLIFVLIGGLLAAPARAADPTDPLVQALSNRVEEMQTLGSVQVQGTPIGGRILLPAIYAGQDFQPLWTNPARVQELIDLVRSAPEDGLLPEDYLVDQIETQRRAADASRSPVDIANLDLILTESVVRYGYHQLFGKVNAAEIDSDVNFTRTFFDGREPAEAIPQFIASPTPLQTQLDQFVHRSRSIAGSRHSSRCIGRSPPKAAGQG